MDDRTTVDYDHTLVRYSFFMVYDHVAYGRSQTLASVGLSVFYRFCSRRMVDHRFSLVWGSLRLAPISRNIYYCITLWLGCLSDYTESARKMSDTRLSFHVLHLYFRWYVYA